MPFPEDNIVLGRYLVPCIDLVPALTYKILRDNGEVFHESTYHALTTYEVESYTEKDFSISFMH